MSIPTTINVYAFSGGLCRIHAFETGDGSRYCLTIFSLSDYKHLHFPHDEYKWLIRKLYAHLSTQAIFPTASNSDARKLNDVSIKLLPFDDDFKIKFGRHNLTIGPVTAFGLVKTSPFADIDVFSVNKKNHITCDPKLDICICKTCPVFSRLIEYEARGQRLFHRKPENVIFTSDFE